MVNNHSILKLLKEILVNSNNLKKSYSSLDETVEFFNYLNSTKENFNSAYLLNYIYQNISAKDVAKRKTTARDFEDYLSILFSGRITDEIQRRNDSITIPQIENDFITNFAISNKREKADIIFENDFELSVKTLMLSNKEINLGSFEKTAVFHELDVYDFLTERKGKKGLLNGEEVKIGLGSKALLKNLLLLLKEKDNYNTFKIRFLKMAKEIFSDDMVIAIKNDLEMDLYFIKGEDFYNLFRDNINDINNFMSIVNRWEGNSIRVDREQFLNIATHVKLDFTFIQDSILKYFQEFEDKTTKILVKYINDIDNKELYQKEMCAEIENIINLIEQKIKGTI
jgi:hypothetical protein